MALREFKGDKERIKNLQHLLKSRPLGPLLKRNLSDSTGIVPGSTITLPITQDHTLIGQEAIDGQKIIDKYDLARGGKKSRKKRRKKKKKSRRRNKKAGFLFTGLGYYLYQTKMNGKKAIFNLPVQYKDSEPVAKVAQADPTPPPAKGGKKSRKKRKRKSKKTRKRRGGADSLRDGIRKIYEGKRSLNFITDSGPGSWGQQLGGLYDKYQEHLHALSSGQKFARKVKNIFRKGDSKKPLTEGEADHIFYQEAKNMIRILDGLLLSIKQSIIEIHANPDAQLYPLEERSSDPEKARLSSLQEQVPELMDKQRHIVYSISLLDELMREIKGSRANSIASSFDSTGYQGSMDSDSSFNTANSYNN